MKNLCFVSCAVSVLNINQAFGAEEGMPQLNPEFWISQIFWLTLNYVSKLKKSMSEKRELISKYRDDVVDGKKLTRSTVSELFNINNK